MPQDEHTRPEIGESSRPDWMILPKPEVHEPLALMAIAKHLKALKPGQEILIHKGTGHFDDPLYVLTFKEERQIKQVECTVTVIEEDPVEGRTAAEWLAEQERHHRMGREFQIPEWAGG